MCHPFPPHNLNKSHEEDSQIKEKRAVLKIIFIELNLNRDGKLIPAVYLRPAGKAGDKNMDALFRP